MTKEQILARVTDGECQCCEGSSKGLSTRTGEILASERKERKITQKDMALNMRISTAYLSMLEKKKRSWSFDQVEAYIENL